VEAEQ
jgi:hypothetical protein